MMYGGPPHEYEMTAAKVLQMTVYLHQQDVETFCNVVCDRRRLNAYNDKVSKKFTVGASFYDHLKKIVLGEADFQADRCMRKSRKVAKSTIDHQNRYIQKNSKSESKDRWW